jgi:hypothetical protein
MLILPRKVNLPIVLAVAVATLAIAGYTFVFLGWFRSFYDAYIGANDASRAMVLYRRYYWLGIPAELAVLGVGCRLLYAAEVRADYLAWYASVSTILIVLWFVLSLLVERTVFVEYGLPA